MRHTRLETTVSLSTIHTQGKKLWWHSVPSQGWRIVAIAAPIKCAAIDVQSHPPPFASVWSGIALERIELLSIGIGWTSNVKSRFNLGSDDNRVRMPRLRGNHLNPTFSVQMVLSIDALFGCHHKRQPVIPNIDPRHHGNSEVLS
ncbi:hypothetical protein TNCV_4358541 [Trichonephila clavipes]|nr:hypothetical protein TNCV_4358541 [Trichonephila clavipes]